MSGTIRAALDGVAQTFRLHELESPIHDAAGRLEPLLALQLKGYADDDPITQPQPAIPLEVIRKVRAMRGSDHETAIGQLVVTAFIFAMRSCEYSDVKSGRLTTVVKVADVAFRTNGDIIPSDNFGRTSRADSVSITFRK